MYPTKYLRFDEDKYQVEHKSLKTLEESVKFIYHKM